MKKETNMYNKTLFSVVNKPQCVAYNAENIKMVLEQFLCL